MQQKFEDIFITFYHDFFRNDTKFGYLSQVCRVNLRIKHCDFFMKKFYRAIGKT